MNDARMVSTFALIVSFMGVVIGGPATAQQPAPNDERPVAQPLRQGVEVRIRPQDGRATGLPTVDESALRYFASRGDKARVEAEIRRLQSLHPEWEPPADLYGPVAQVDERPLWALYDQGDYAAVRDRIEQLRSGHPDWSPPPRLLALMQENEVRHRLETLESDGAWQQLLEVARVHPAEIACTRIDNMWRVARAHAELGRQDDALATYGRIIEECPSLDHRIATLQKGKRRGWGDEARAPVRARTEADEVARGGASDRAGALRADRRGAGGAEISPGAVPEGGDARGRPPCGARRAAGPRCGGGREARLDVL